MNHASQLPKFSREAHLGMIKLEDLARNMTPAKRFDFLREVVDLVWNELDRELDAPSLEKRKRGHLDLISKQ